MVGGEYTNTNRTVIGGSKHHRDVTVERRTQSRKRASQSDVAFLFDRTIQITAHRTSRHPSLAALPVY